VKRAVRIHWRLTIGIIKALVAVPLSIIGIGAFALLWSILTVTKF